MSTDLTHTIAETPTAQPYASAGRSIGIPLVLFVLTCISVASTPEGLLFAIPLMITLLAHEFGHFLQAIRHGVPASLPMFIPMPISPIGTMGAVIGMKAGRGDRRAIFDIAITGPIAGLVFALIFSVVGLHLSTVVPANQYLPGKLGVPLLFEWLAHLTIGDVGPTNDIVLHPIAFAGWVGMFITALNLIPIGQLDGGHILYALLRERAHLIAQLLLAGAIVAVVVNKYWGWSLMLLLVMLMGPNHPPTENDDVPLGTTRTVLGWLSLLFVIVGFTPTPFIM